MTKKLKFIVTFAPIEIEASCGAFAIEEAIDTYKEMIETKNSFYWSDIKFERIEEEE